MNQKTVSKNKKETPKTTPNPPQEGGVASADSIKSKKSKKTWNAKLSSFLIWLIFILFVLFGGFVLYSKFKDFDIQTQEIQQMISQIPDIPFFNLNGSVIGVNDEVLEDEVVDDVSNVDSEANIANEIETERQEQLHELLLLQLPDETDNPNYPVTFANPTEDGVEIKIDDQEYENAESPYMLPSLSLGAHTISFRFKDEDGVARNLEDELIVIPRVPVLNSNQKTDFSEADKILFEGTALPNSKIICVVGSSIVTQVIDVDNSGNWTLDLTDVISAGDHNVVFMTRKSGFSSNFSDPFDFSVGQIVGVESQALLDNTEDNLSFIQSFESKSLWEGNNYIYILSGLGVLVLLFLSSMYFATYKGKLNLQIISRIKKTPESETEKNEDSDKKTLSNDDAKPVSIREKLESLNRESSESVSKLEVSEDESTEESEDSGEVEVLENDQEAEESELVGETPSVEEIPSAKAEVKKSKKVKGKEKDLKKVYSKEEFLEEFEDDVDAEADDDTKIKDDENVKSRKDVKKNGKSKAKRIEITLTSN